MWEYLVDLPQLERNVKLDTGMCLARHVCMCTCVSLCECVCVCVQNNLDRFPVIFYFVQWSVNIPFINLSDGHFSTSQGLLNSSSLFNLTFFPPLFLSCFAVLANLLG